MQIFVTFSGFSSLCGNMYENYIYVVIFSVTILACDRAVISGLPPFGILRSFPTLRSFETAQLPGHP